MEAGLIGLPYVGKTALFSALTGMAPEGVHGRANVGTVHVPDPRLDVIASFIETKKLTHATLKIVDIPGLASGSGDDRRGQILADVRDVDALCHVVRCFEDDSVPHPDGSIDPLRDIEALETELILADMQVVENALPKAERAARGKDPDAKIRYAVLQKIAPVLEEAQPVRTLLESGAISDDSEIKILKGLAMLTAKRVLYVANVGDDDVDGEGEHAQKVKAHAEKEQTQCVTICAKIEAELAELEEPDRSEMLEGLGLKSPALPTLAAGLQRLMGLQVFYTAGVKEVRAWTIPQGAAAQKAAGAIHSDIARGFIRAEVYGIGDLQEYKTEKAIKDAGKMRVEGKSYVMQDGDIVHFLFNV